MSTRKRERTLSIADTASKLRTALVHLEAAEQELWDGVWEGAWDESLHRQAKWAREEVESRLKLVEQTMWANYTTVIKQG